MLLRIDEYGEGFRLMIGMNFGDETFPHYLFIPYENSAYKDYGPLPRFYFTNEEEASVALEKGKKWLANVQKERRKGVSMSLAIKAL